MTGENKIYVTKFASGDSNRWIQLFSCLLLLNSIQNSIQFCLNSNKKSPVSSMHYT